MMKKGFNRSSSEPNLFTKLNEQGLILIVCLYVDDLTFSRNLSIDMFKFAMKKEFEMTNLDLMKYFFVLKSLKVIRVFLFVKVNMQKMF